MKFYHPIFIVLVFVISLFSCSTQADPIEVEIDSLFDKALLSGADSIGLIANNIYLLSKENGYEYGEIRGKILAGFYYWNTRKTDTANYILGECLAFFQQNKSFENNIDHGRSFQYQSMVDMRIGNLINARANASEALRIFDRNKNWSYKGKALNLLGSVEFNLNNYPEALEYYHEARKNKELIENGDIHSELINISNVYGRMNQDSLALKYAKEALDLADGMKQSVSKINILNSIGTIQSKLGRQDSAIYYYTLCKETSLENSNSFMAFLSNMNTANAYSKLNEIEKSNEIVLTELRNPPLSFEATVNILKSKNFFKLGNYDSAIRIAHSTFSKSIVEDQKQTIINASEVLMSSYQHTGQYDSAFKYSTLHFAYKDSIYNQESQQKFSDLRVKIETLEKQNEIDVLEKERKLSKIRNQAITGLVSGVAIIAFLAFKNYQSRQKAREANLKLKTAQLSEELEKKKSLLSAHTLNMIHRNNGFDEIEQHIDDLDGPAKSKIKRIIKMNKAMDKDWENFYEYFSQVHRDFYKQVSSLHENLSTNEKKLIALIKLNLSSREISSLLNIELKSITMAKYRLKKKLELEEHEELNDYIQKL
jgi:predicted negative regulator of RcsB-dependent stress response/DNA-binding CsgD family transcriptional regulator